MVSSSACWNASCSTVPALRPMISRFMASSPVSSSNCSCSAAFRLVQQCHFDDAEKAVMQHERRQQQRGRHGFTESGADGGKTGRSGIDHL